MTNPNKVEFQKFVVEAAAHYESGRLAEADASYRAALASWPGHGVVTHNLGVVAAARGEHERAIGCFDQAIAADSSYVSAHYNRAVALMALGDAREAIKGFSRACTLEPQHYDSHRALGFLWLSLGQRGRALDHFARTYELRRGEDRTPLAAKSMTMTTRDKLQHDAEQFTHLSQRLRDGQRFETRARNYREAAEGVSDQLTPLSQQQIDLLGVDYNTAIHIRNAPEIAGPAVNLRPDGDALTRQFNDDGAGVVYFDDLLTPSALVALRQHLLESTIWHDFSHIGGFVASYLEDGLACPLVLQIADEIRGAFPELLGGHPLTQAWVFKGLRSNSAVDVHADDAAITVNFWVTPSQANLEPGHGGLVVCRAAPPPEWTIRDYEGDQSTSVAFLVQNSSSNLTVPYRENRAVLFKSRLLHHSDRPVFQKDYENHRISVTLLFGGQ